jgi:hypothetical protein
MEIRNAANVAVLLQTKDALRERKAAHQDYGIPSIDLFTRRAGQKAQRGAAAARSHAVLPESRSQAVLRRAASSANMRKNTGKNNAAELVAGTRRLGKRADASSRAQHEHGLPLTLWMEKIPIGFELGTRPQSHGQIDPSKDKQRMILDERLAQVKLEKKLGHPRLESSVDCVFLAVADQLLGSTDGDEAQDLRKQCASWLRKNKKFKIRGQKGEVSSPLHSYIELTRYANA